MPIGSPGWWWPKTALGNLACFAKSGFDHAVTQEDAGFAHAAHGVGNAERVSFAFGSDQDSQRSGDTQPVQSSDSAAQMFVDANGLDALVDRELHDRGFAAIKKLPNNEPISTSSLRRSIPSAAANSAAPNIVPPLASTSSQTSRGTMTCE